jgi:16S rRNA processing protein RimM
VSAKTHRFVTLGRVSGVFGLKGWLKVQSYTEPRGNIAGFGAWTLRLRGADHIFDLESGQEHAGGVVAKLQGIDDCDVARTWMGAEIVVERDQLPAIAPDEYYWADLEGLEVRTTAGEVLGKVAHLLATGTHDVLVLGGKPERLIPFVTGTVIKRVDLAAGLIVADWSTDY